jgi:hypothetical protein
MSLSTGGQHAAQSGANGLRWFKSSRSNFSGNCVEAAQLPREDWAVRDSKNKDRGTLIFGASEWASFVAAIKNGEFDF